MNMKTFQWSKYFLVSISLAALLAFGGEPLFQAAHAQQKLKKSPALSSKPISIQLTQTQWVAQSLTQIQSIHAGMTRAQLLRIFQPANGLSSREQQSLEYRACPYFQVRVQFHAVGKDIGDMGNPHDKITFISQPVVEQGSFHPFMP